MAKLKRIGNQRKLGEQAYKVVKEAIMSGKFPPGNWLAEDELKDALGVSRTPVREAFRQLQAEGLIELFPRKGAYIVPLTDRDIVNLFEVREALETAFFMRSAKKMRLEKLKRFQRKFKEAEEEIFKIPKESEILRDKWREYLKVDRAFHDELVKATENPYWLKLYLNIRDRMQVFGFKMGHMPDQIQMLSKQHNAILEALLVKKYAEAKKRLREHLQYVRDVFIKTI